MPKSRKVHRKTHRKQRKHRKQLGGGLSEVLPTTTWGAWASYPGALAWSANTQAPPPLANGGLYTGPQSTGEWASKPFPATQYAEAIEASRIANNPDVFWQQRPNDNTGASFSPYVGDPISNEHWSATAGPSLQAGGGKRNRKNKSRKHRSKKNRK